MANPLTRVVTARFTSSPQLVRRGFSGQIVGSAPTDLLQAGNPGYAYFAKNLERFRSQGRITHYSPKYLSSAPEKEQVLIRKMFQEILQTNETLLKEIRVLNSKVELLLK